VVIVGNGRWSSDWLLRRSYTVWAEN